MKTYGRLSRARRAVPSRRRCSGVRRAAACVAAAGRRGAGARAAAARRGAAAPRRCGSRAARSAGAAPPGARATRAPTARAATRRAAARPAAPPSAPPSPWYKTRLYNQLIVICLADITESSQLNVSQNNNEYAETNSFDFMQF